MADPSDVTATDLRVDSTHVPAPVPCTVITPAGTSSDAALPLVLALHGGAGGDEFADQVRELVTLAWATDALPPCAVAVPQSGRSFWLDRADGSERWETFLTTDLPAAVREAAPVDADSPTALLGISMGGLGVLRLAFRRPGDYVAVAALEPAVEPTLDWDGVDPDTSMVRSLELFESFHGSPVDPEHFAANHPPALIVAGADALRAADLAIYLECGDEDVLGLYKAAELMHRMLYDRRIAHEYHLVRGADHVGDTLPRRFTEAVAFLGRALRPPPPDPVAAGLRQLLGR